MPESWKKMSSEANKQTKTLPGWQEVGTEPLGPLLQGF